MIVFDGCAGTGSATKPFADRGHIVETLDIVGDQTYTMDIRDFHPGKEYDFMWFSPDCTEFSNANYRLGPCKDRDPDMSIVEACLRIVEEAKPRFWIMENPRGCLRHFVRKPAATVKYADFGYCSVKPTDLWGVFPFFFSRVPRTTETRPIQHMVSSGNPQRSAVPYELGRVICLSIEEIINHRRGD